MGHCCSLSPADPSPSPPNPLPCSSDEETETDALNNHRNTSDKFKDYQCDQCSETYFAFKLIFFNFKLEMEFLA